MYEKKTFPVSSQTPRSAVLFLIALAFALTATASFAVPLQGRETWSQETVGISDFAEAFDGAGTAVVVADFNSDGFDDLAIGIPADQSDNMVAGAGRVLILEGSDSGLQADSHIYLDQGHTAGGIEEDDFFGSVLLAGDFNHDNYPDLAVGVPFEDIELGQNNVLDNAGEVNIFWGSPQGLSNSNVFVIDETLQWIPGAPTANALFGFSLDAMQIDQSVGDELAIGVPFDQRQNGDVVGSVVVVKGSASAWFVNQAAERHFPNGVPNNPQVAPAFGWDVAFGDFYGPGQPGLVVGVPGHSFQRGRFDAFLVDDDNDDLVTFDFDQHNGGQNGEFFGYTVARYDNLNDGHDELMVGAPGRDAIVNNNILQLDAGTVWLYHVAQPALEHHYRPWTVEVSESAETEDRFGQVMHVADVDGDGHDDLIVGVPDEDLEDGNNTVANAGVLHVLFGPAEDSNRRQVKMDADSDSLQGTSALAQARFGAAIGAGRFDGDLLSIAVGVPGEDVGNVDGAGSVTILDTPLFSDDFESGDLSAWSSAVGAI